MDLKAFAKGLSVDQIEVGEGLNVYFWIVAYVMWEYLVTNLHWEFAYVSRSFLPLLE